MAAKRAHGAGHASASAPHPHGQYRCDDVGPAPPPGSDDATVKHSFGDVDKWVARFDTPEREAWQQPDALVSALGIQPGQSVAELGAGTGYFSARWARAVGPDGAVFAMDVEPALVAHLRGRAEREATAAVVPVLGSLDDARLPPASADWIVLVNVYHHIGARRAYFARLARALRPGGRLVVVDFLPGDLPVGPPATHKIPEAQVRDELAEAGYTFERHALQLPYQYALVFSR